MCDASACLPNPGADAGAAEAAAGLLVGVDAVGGALESFRTDFGWVR